jgi:hypothetical protein
MSRFYGHFAAAYGTLWFILMLAVVFSQSHINAGEFGSDAENSEALELARGSFRHQSLTRVYANGIASLVWHHKWGELAAWF